MILCIDTSMDHASLAIAKEDKVMASRENPVQKDHASLIHPAIKSMMEEWPWADLKAVAVSAGPGSYTGLRVGMATAKYRPVRYV